MASSAAKRYAQAIFSLGKDEGTLDTWGQDLAMLSRVVADERIDVPDQPECRRGAEDRGAGNLAQYQCTDGNA